MRIGVNPLIWINDDKPELGADVPLERCLSEARAAGYAGIEMGHRFPQRVSELRPLLERHRLSLISGWYSARLVERGADRELEAMRDHVELLRAMECDTLIFGETSGAVHREARPLSARPVLGASEWTQFTRELDRVARMVRREGLRLAYHHHVGTIVETAAEIERLMAETSEAVGLLLDTGHLAYGDRDATPLTTWAERYAHRIAHVHLKDVRRDVLARAHRDDVPFLDAVCEGVFTVPGDGGLALEPLIATLGRRGYRGWVVVEAEQDPAIAHPLTYATMGFENATRMVARSLPPMRAASRTPRGPRGRDAALRPLLRSARTARPRGRRGRSVP